jgi:hypothetical protein
MDFVADTKARQEFVQAAEQITAHKPENLGRSDLGELGFQDAEPLFRRIIEFFASIKGSAWDRTPGDRVRHFLDLTKNLRDRLESVINFNVHRTNPSRARSDLITVLGQEFNDLFGVMGPFVGLEMIMETGQMVRSRYEKDAADAMQQMGAMLADMKAQFESTKQLIASTRTEFEEEKARSKAILAEVEKTAKLIGVTHEAGHFKLAADAYACGAIKWLVTAAICVVLLLGFLVWISIGNGLRPKTPVTTRTNAAVTSNTVALSTSTQTPSHPGADAFTIVQYTFPRLVIFTLLSTALVFALRNYSAQSHNKVINLHRQTALSSFQTFVASTKDEATKNAILIQATTAIYAPQPSGHLKGDSEVPQSPQIGLITDLVRAGTGKSEK